MLCSFVINKLKTLREPHSLALYIYTLSTIPYLHSSLYTVDFYSSLSWSSKSISIYDREIGAKISVSVSIS